MATFTETEIGDVVDRVRSWSPATESSDAEFTYIDLSSVDKDNKSIVSPVQIPCADAPSRARQLVAYRDILVSTVRPNLNGVASVPAELDGATASTGFCVLRPRPDKVCWRYLYHWVRSPAFIRDMTRKATGASYPAVSDRIIHDSKIPLPKLEEQKRIAAILDKADAIRRKRQESLNELTSLPGSLFGEWFGNPVTNSRNFPMVELREVISLTGGFAFRSEDYRSDGIPLIRIGNANNSKFSEDALVYLPEKYMHEFARYVLRPGDMIMTLTGTVGKDDYANIVEVPDNYEQWFLNQRVARVALTDERLIKHYLIQFLMTPHVKNLIRRMDRGVRQANLRNDDILGQQIPVPPLNLQIQFARAITQCEKLRRNMVCEQQVSDDLLNSLVQRAFKGGL